MHKRPATISSSGTSGECFYHQIKCDSAVRRNAAAITATAYNTTGGRNDRKQPLAALVQLALLFVVYSLLTTCCVMLVRSQETSNYFHADSDEISAKFGQSDESQFDGFANNNNIVSTSPLRLPLFKLKF
jgi:hypothetical protein